MSYHDIHEFIRVLESREELRRIDVEVSPDLEIAEIARTVRNENGPALLFENVKGVGFPILTNIFGSLERLKLALGIDDFDSVGKQILDLFSRLGSEMSFSDKMTFLSKLARVASLFPKRAKSGACKDVPVRRPSFHILPAIRWERENLPTISFCLCLAAPPNGGVQRMSMCKMEVFNEVTAGIQWNAHDEMVGVLAEYGELGIPMEVAVVLGGDPATMYSATVPVPNSFDKMILAGLLRDSAVELVKCETMDIWVPAHAEIVLEGNVELSHARTPGFINTLGKEVPVFHLRHITHRKNAICPATVVGSGPLDMDVMARATERLVLPLLRLQFPEVVELNTPLEGVLKDCVIISIKKRYPGHARKIMHAFWGIDLTMLAKEIIVVDESVNPHDTASVMERVLGIVDFDRHIEIVRGPVSDRDSGYGCKIGIDATTRFPGEVQREISPVEKRMMRDVASAVVARWNSEIRA